jgi:hypothetical protein
MTAASQTRRLTDLIFLTGQKFRYVYTADRRKICAKCCGHEYKNFALDKRWRVLADQVNRTGCTLKCDNCGGSIESISI